MDNDTLEKCLACQHELTALVTKWKADGNNELSIAASLLASGVYLARTALSREAVAIEAIDLIGGNPTPMVVETVLAGASDEWIAGYNDRKMKAEAAAAEALDTVTP